VSEHDPESGEEQECRACLGSGKKALDGSEFAQDCPFCFGTGKR